MIKLNSPKFKNLYFIPLRKCKECAKTILTYKTFSLSKGWCMNPWEGEIVSEHEHLQGSVRSKIFS